MYKTSSQSIALSYSVSPRLCPAQVGLFFDGVLMSTIPTMKVKAPGGGYMIINQCDFEEGEYVRFEEKTKAKAKATTKKVVKK